WRLPWVTAAMVAGSGVRPSSHVAAGSSALSVIQLAPEEFLVVTMSPAVTAVVEVVGAPLTWRWATPNEGGALPWRMTRRVTFSTASPERFGGESFWGSSYVAISGVGGGEWGWARVARGDQRARKWL